MAKPDDHAKLQEVKAVLARLQRMSSDPDGYFADIQEPSSADTRRTHARPSIYGMRGAALGGGLLAAGLATGAVFLLPSADPSPPGPAEVNTPAALQLPAVAVSPFPAPAPEEALPATPPAGRVVAPLPPSTLPQPDPAEVSAGAATRLINSGQILAGREMLLKLAEQKVTAEIAWGLARSYDPNLINSISAPDAGADVAEAERWYRRWHTHAVEEGLVSGTASVDRILRTLK